MRVHELLLEIKQDQVITVNPDMSVLEASQRLSEHNVGALPVVDAENNLAGIISERDIVRSIARIDIGFLDNSVSDIMTASVVTCSPDDTTEEIAVVMGSRSFRHIPVVSEGKLLAMLSVRDFDNAVKKLRAQSLTDELTGVHNASYFSTILDNEFNRYRRFESPLCVAAIQVDNFNNLCAASGNITGDAILKKLAEIMGDETRAYDAIGRISNDQFAVVFPNTNMNTAERACSRIVKAVKETDFLLGEESDAVTISIGLVTATHDSQNGRSIILRSKELLQVAIENGGRTIEMDNQDSQEIQLVANS